MSINNTTLLLFTAAGTAIIGILLLIYVLRQRKFRLDSIRATWIFGIITALASGSFFLIWASRLESSHGGDPTMILTVSTVMAGATVTILVITATRTIIRAKKRHGARAADA